VRDRVEGLKAQVVGQNREREQARSWFKQTGQGRILEGYLLRVTVGLCLYIKYTAFEAFQWPGPRGSVAQSDMIDDGNGSMC
jgi:hypothetical protein